MIPILLAAVLAQSPDFVEARGRGSDHHVLAAGGWVYRWSGGQSLALWSSAGAPASSLSPCDPQTVVVVGRGGLLRVLRSGKALGVGAPGADLWDVASNGCEDVVIAGDAGLLVFAVGQEQAAAPAGAPAQQVPLYGASIHGERATAVGAGGRVLHRPSRAAPWHSVPSHTSASLLAVHQRADGGMIVAGEGGLWRGDERGLTQMWSEPAEAYLRLSFADDEVGVALGQQSVVVTWNGGRTWTRFDRPGWLAAAPVGEGAFFLYGRDGRVERFAPPPPRPAPILPPRRAGRQPSPAPAPVPSVSPSPAPVPAAASPDSPARPAPLPEAVDDPSCRGGVSREGISGPGFVDLRQVGKGFLLAGADGTVRRFEGGRMETLVAVGVPMLGVAVDAARGQVTVVGAGRIAHSADQGRTWSVEETPEGAIVFAAAYAGRTLLVFDDRGRGHRRAGEGWEALELPRRATFFSAHFVDALRGYVVGRCGTLLETTDGGASWQALTAPTDDLQGVVAVGNRLHVAGQQGVFLSEDRGRSWARVLAVDNCMRMAARQGEVAVACGNLGQPLWTARDGRRFTPVRVERIIHLLLAAAYDAGGALYAVGPSEVVVRASAGKGKLAYDSAVSRAGLKRAQDLWMALRREERARPRTEVATPTVTSPGGASPLPQGG